MCKISSGFKIPYFPNGKHILTNSDKFLKFEEMEYLIHPVKVEMWPALCKFPILFSAMKFKLRHSIFQVINILELQNWNFQAFFPIHKEKENWDFCMLLQLELLIFHNFWKNFQVFPSSLNSWEISFPLLFYLLDCKDCLSGRLNVLGREGNSHYVTTFWQVKCWKHCLRPYTRVTIAKFSWSCAAACFAQVFPSIQ